MDQVYACISLHANKAISNKEIWREEKPSYASLHAQERSLQERQLKWKNGRSVSEKWQ